MTTIRRRRGFVVVMERVWCESLEGAFLEKRTRNRADCFKSSWDEVNVAPL